MERPVSANNWAICPRCKADRQKAANAARLKADKAYGKVDVAEFDELRAKAAELAKQAVSDGHDYRTFREDYEIWGAEEGEIFIGYSGGCSECGLTLRVEHRHPLAVDRSDQ